MVVVHQHAPDDHDAENKMRRSGPYKSLAEFEPVKELYNSAVNRVVLARVFILCA